MHIQLLTAQGLQDLFESADAVKRKQTITYDDLGAQIKHDKAKL